MKSLYITKKMYGIPRSIGINESTRVTGESILMADEIRLGEAMKIRQERAENTISRTRLRGRAL